MSNYNIQYKAYYDELKRKNNVSVSNEKVTYDEGIPIYRGSHIYANNKRNKDGFMANLIITQLVGTMMLFLVVFGAKYSSNEEVLKYYTKFKNEVNKEYTYTNAEVNAKEGKVDFIKDKFNSSMEWLKEVFNSDSFTY